MEPIEWNQNFETGCQDIDLQHHYFLNLINHFIEATKQHKQPKVIEAMIHELNAYVHFHFSSEERMMIEYGYPEYTNHRTIHLDLIQHLNIEVNYINCDDSKNLEKVTSFLVEWFLHHTTTEDKKFSEFLAKR